MLSLKTDFPKILLPIKTELELVNENIKNGMLLKAGHVSDFANLELNWCDKYLHPAVLILSAYMFGYNNPQVITMATSMQFLYLGTGIHFGKYDQRLGLPVLIGDYFYSKFFSYMCNGEALEWLAPTANVVCDIHVAGIRENENAQLIRSDSNEYIKILKEQMGLLGFCAAFGAFATKAEKNFKDSLVNFGKNLGTSIQLLRNKQNLNIANQLLKEAKLGLRSLPVGLEREVLNDLINYCSKAHKNIDMVS